MEQTLQERLAAEAEEAHENWLMENEARNPWHPDAWLAVADGILNSPVIREMRQQDRARGLRIGWDDGHLTGKSDQKTGRPETSNPYKPAVHTHDAEGTSDPTEEAGR